jgi:competence protein ComEC
MLRYFNKPFYNQVPALRLLIPFVIGILIQFHFKLNVNDFIFLAIVGLLLFTVFSLFNINIKHKYKWVAGVSVSIIFIAFGGLICYIKNIEHRKNWVTKFYNNATPALLTIQEPIVEKPKSYKALAKVNALYVNNTNWQKTEGDILLYFNKDSSIPDLKYGSQIIVIQNFNPIINAGNPGGFNYAQYSAFQNIHYQLFLKDNEYSILPTSNIDYFKQVILSTKQYVLQILKNFIKDKNQLSIAEALLIGHRDNLDRDLVQSYSNTGVVHIIAISGLHLGMIYGLLILLFKPLSRFKITRYVKPIFILIILWSFCFVAGASPSILRSAVMFSFIVLGETISKQTNIYNSLAVSAVLLLLLNPFNLWDVGFQLSYSAVVSIVAFQKQISNLFYFKNKIIRFLWNLNAVTLAAQILTLPIVLYHFHQFPTLFMFTNLIAVPLSGLILYLEIFLLIIASLHPINLYVGKLIGILIEGMNQFILFADNLPFSILPSIQISIIQAIVLLAAICCVWIWLYQKKFRLLIYAISFIAVFFIIRGIDFFNKSTQQKLIVYNVPKHSAIDLIEGRQYKFLGDSVLINDGFLRNFHIKPSRTLHRISPANKLKNFNINGNLISCNGKTILLIKEGFVMPTLKAKLNVDVIVLTGNPTVYLKDLHQTFNCKYYVFDSSNPFWKIAYWKKDADSLHLQHHNTLVNGAFVMNL